jgi:hypothetical protein
MCVNITCLERWLHDLKHLLQFATAIQCFDIDARDICEEEGSYLSPPNRSQTVAVVRVVSCVNPSLIVLLAAL